MEKYSTRRSFFGKAAIVSGAAVTGSKKVTAQSRKNPTCELIKVGMACVGSNSHWSLWAPTINPVEGSGWPGRSTRMIITHCWDSKPEVAEKFAKRFKCEAVKNYYDMVDKVDAIIFAGFFEAPWWEQLTRPYLEAGIPCYIDRPLGLNMKTAKKIVETAKKHNTPILATDGHLILEEAKIGRCLVEKYRREGKEIIGATSYNYTTSDYPQHGIHGLFYLFTILGMDVESISFMADGWWRDVTPTNPTVMTWGNITLLYRGLEVDGVENQKTSFLATQLQVQDDHSFANIRIYYTAGRNMGEWVDVDNRQSRYHPMDRRYYLNFPTVFYMQRMFETREMPFSYDRILKQTKIFLAGFKSHIDHNGELYPVDDLPDDWTAPTPYPDWIDESIF